MCDEDEEEEFQLRRQEMITVQRCEAHRVRHRLELYDQQMTVNDHSALVCCLVVVVGWCGSRVVNFPEI